MDLKELGFIKQDDQLDHIEVWTWGETVDDIYQLKLVYDNHFNTNYCMVLGQVLNTMPTLRGLQKLISLIWKFKNV